MSTAVAPASPAADPERLPGRVSYLALVLGVALIVAGNFVVRAVLEARPLPHYPVFPENKVPLSWRLLLPVDYGSAENAIHKPGTYYWFTTGLTVVELAKQYATPETV